MNRNTFVRNLAPATFSAILGIVSSGAFGASVSHSAQLGPQSLQLTAKFIPFSEQWTNTASGNVILPRFDPCLGELESIVIELEDCSSLKWNGTHLVASISGVNANMNETVCVSGSGISPSLCCSKFFNQSGTFTPQQSSLEFNYGTQCCTVQTGVSSAQWASYIGAGTISLPVGYTFAQEATTSNGPMTCVFTVTPTTVVTITYTYAPVCADLDGDGQVDGSDLGILLSMWDTDDAAADFTNDGVVDGADLGFLLATWGECPACD